MTLDKDVSASPMDNMDVLERIVQQHFHIEDYTLGSARQNYLIRYHGRLITESSLAYDKIADGLGCYGLTPLFRVEEGRQTVYLVKGMPNPKPAKARINLILFILTFISVLISGALYGMDEPLPQGILPSIMQVVERGWPFAVSLLVILGAHEFGHYLAGKHHGAGVTLPYFIPFPFSAFGTMGAFINMQRPPKNRNVLVDIGIAGPLSGLVFAIPVLILGLSLSSIDVLPPSVPEGMTYQIEGNSILYLALKYLVFGKLLPAPADLNGLSPLLYWLKYFFTGTPIPFGGMDVMIHPVAWAGWAGILVTGLNLLPAGQLDGGHMLYVLFGKKAAGRVYPFVLVSLLLLGIFWNGWWLWAVLIFFLGRTHAEPLDQITPLDNRRKILAASALVLFCLTFTPVPLTLVF